MTDVLITIDTELSAGLHGDKIDCNENIDRSIFAKAGNTQVGIIWQMDQMERRGIKGVFFVDPMPALVYGPECVEQIVTPILERGHEVQLHIHTEWLKWARRSPVGERKGRNIADFSLADQKTLIDVARNVLVAAGAIHPSAFRAGNFGANGDTLRALSALGIRWDSSYNVDFTPQGSELDSLAKTDGATMSEDVTELPISGIWDRPGHFRPAQVCALSQREMRSALAHAATNRASTFVIVTHSFEMLSRDRRRVNKCVKARFESLCDCVAELENLRSVGFSDLDQDLACTNNNAGWLPPSRLRTFWRFGEQAIAQWRYER